VSSGDAMSDETMMWDEVADIGALLHELDDEAFDTPSLCDGWAVRDGPYGHWPYHPHARDARPDRQVRIQRDQGVVYRIQDLVRRPER
jgi:hypothetical protein